MSEAILLLALVTVLVIVAKSYSTAQNDSGPPCQTTRSLSARRWNEKKTPKGPNYRKSDVVKNRHVIYNQA